MLRSMSDGVSDPVLNKIGAKHHELKQQYDEMETYFPENSFDPRMGRVDADMVRRKRIIYRSKQRGWLEVDLMLGRFAEAHVMEMSNEELDAYEQILSQETIDIFNIISGKEAGPDELQGKTLEKVKQFCETDEMRKLKNYQ